MYAGMCSQSIRQPFLDRGVHPMGDEAEIFIIAILGGNFHFRGRKFL